MSDGGKNWGDSGGRSKVHLPYRSVYVTAWVHVPTSKQNIFKSLKRDPREGCFLMVAGEPSSVPQGEGADIPRVTAQTCWPGTAAAGPWTDRPHLHGSFDKAPEAGHRQRWSNKLLGAAVLRVLHFCSFYLQEGTRFSCRRSKRETLMALAAQGRSNPGKCAQSVQLNTGEEGLESILSAGKALSPSSPL